MRRNIAQETTATARWPFLFMQCALRLGMLARRTGEGWQMQKRLVRSALALAVAAAAWAGAAGAVVPWRVCRAETPVKDGTVHAVQSGAFDASPIGSFEERMFAQRPFESALRAIGATGLKDATVKCTGPELDRAKAEAQGKTLREKAIAAYPAPAPKRVEGAWTVVIKPGVIEPVLLAGLGEHASPATLASSPETWGLTARDFSVTHAAALLAKAGLPARKREFAAAAAQGDAYAQYLLAVRLGQDDDPVMMEKAAKQGLVRAISDFHVMHAVEGSPDPKPHLAELVKMARLGNAHAKYIAGRAFGTHKTIASAERMFAVSNLLQADKMDYAPAQLWVANDLRDSTDDYQWRTARKRAELAAAQGLPEAKEFLAKYPPR